MKLTVKPLKGEPFQIDVELTNTVKELKQVIFDKKQWEITCQKLIHAGKIMADDKNLSDYKVKENGFIVCMVSKPKAPPKPASTPTPAAAPAAATPAPAAAAAPPAAAAPTPAAAPAPTPPATAAPPANSPFSGPAFEESIAQLKDMGFPESECRAALQAAFGDRGRAVEYLMSGIPPGAAEAAAAQAAAPAQTPAATQPNAAGGEPLAALRQHPQFNNLRRVVQNNPGALSTVLQQIGQGNPQLLEEINNNREEFVRIMNEPLEEGTGGNTPSAADAAAAIAGSGGMPAGVPHPEEFLAVLTAVQQMPPDQRARVAQAMGVPPEQLQAITQMMQNMPAQARAQMMEGMMQGGFRGVGGPGAPGGAPGGGNVVHLTQEEAAAVDRLAELGFSKQACVEAYLACDKDEQLAANYLFTNPPDAMEEDNSGGST
uniref:UV excision repair protein RAD23 n=1 Tax=Mucochytrium quahogii TaxID=96639 RepID=A0A7S2W866_9STRA|mmetsp:Transcript_19390/g.31916  ORF Transcript_19390/g.31916 Transcript_19390/m.31916 type:complete len:431 (+) Transcript_19390:50-1342(+)|eukprot:CAMPEP_0203759454 /NCGR_PEP_ID=MMETSP0098-20131031/12495_1 /ASSEMBLY_ACC=CAM_ASM_000208 /TAXON_ID=96639 /ORGANISM=" , Strain NY0313808BC1" /LENGTH=430 /DNA_ID=CAMNT_0050652425 /DNA_START=19 /DNA_END=1311 /DNA_ORIENTATION=+